MINAFVLCKKCGNPETVNTIIGKKKNTTVNLICRSCGHVVELDNTDKFVKYIIIHTPKIDTLYEKGKEEVQEREEVQKQGDGGEQGGNGGGEVQEKGESDNESIDLDNI
jgi:transcription elongation factor Elf1